MRGLYTEKVVSGKIPFGQLVSEILDAGTGESVSSQIRETAQGSESNVRAAEACGQSPESNVRAAEACGQSPESNVPAVEVRGQSPESNVPAVEARGQSPEVNALAAADDLEAECPEVLAEQFCDDGEGEVNQYNVYKITTREKCYVLKKSDQAEIGIYEHFLKGQGLPVPDYFGSARWGGKQWILIEYIPGTDLREYSSDMAFSCAESLSRIANRYWQEDEADFIRKRQDDRFERYWKRINKRAECLKEEPVLKAAYDIFLERQLTCPRTLSNGDFLQFNAIFRDGKVTLVDWAFGGIMPYALDIARMIAHGTENRQTFPFYMTRAHKELFVERTYELLEHKPSYERYLADIRLAVLNEYIEFIESDLLDSSQVRDEVFDYYYAHALALAQELRLK